MTKTRVGLVGCGHISKAHLDGWARVEGSEVVGLLDMKRELADARQAEFGIQKIYDDLPEMLADVDVVDICTPPKTHAALAGEVLTAGKHLLIEKPLVTEVGQWDRLKAAALEHKVEIVVLHNIKFTRSVQTAKAWLDAGKIGDVIRMNRFYLTHPDVDRMLTGDPHWSHELPGGRWFETLPHEMYLAHFLVGPLEVHDVAVLSTDRRRPGADADEVLITLRGERCFYTVHYSSNCRVNRRQVEITGTKGSIDIDILSDAATLSTLQDEKWMRAAGMPALQAGLTVLQMLPDRAEYVRDRVRKQTPHARIIEAFDAFLRGKGPSPTPLDELDFVVNNCERIGRAIDDAVARLR